MSSLNGSRRRHPKKPSLSKSETESIKMTSPDSSRRQTSSSESDLQHMPRSASAARSRTPKKQYPTSKNFKSETRLGALSASSALSGTNKSLIVPTAYGKDECSINPIELELNKEFQYEDEDGDMAPRDVCYPPIELQDDDVVPEQSDESDYSDKEHEVDYEPDSCGTAANVRSNASSRHITNMPAIHAPGYSDLEVRSTQQPDDFSYFSARKPSSGRRSMHSDSGISMLSSNAETDMTEADASDLQQKCPIIDQESSIVEDNDYSLATEISSQWHNGPNGLTSSGDMYSTMYDMQLSPLPYGEPRASSTPRIIERPSSHRRGSSLLSKIPLSPTRHQVGQQGHDGGSVQPGKRSKQGYELLATHLSINVPDPATIKRQNEKATTAMLTPIYRKFETLNNRMLLYLQDEIAELEEQLAELDEAIALEAPEVSDLKTGPTVKSEGLRVKESRRQQSALPSQLQWHRADLLGRVGLKVEMYNRALTSYTHLLSTLPPASASSISAYKEWIAEHNHPISPTELKFLDHEEDLVTIKAPLSNTSQNMASTNHNQDESRGDFLHSTSQDTKVATLKNSVSPTLFLLAFTFVAIIIVFKVVPSLLARLVICAVVSMAGIVLNLPEEFSQGQVHSEQHTVSKKGGVSLMTQQAGGLGVKTPIYMTGLVILAMVVD